MVRRTREERHADLRFAVTLLLIVALAYAYVAIMGCAQQRRPSAGYYSCTPRGCECFPFDPDKPADKGVSCREVMR